MSGNQSRWAGLYALQIVTLGMFLCFIPVVGFSTKWLGRGSSSTTTIRPWLRKRRLKELLGKTVEFHQLVEKWIAINYPAFTR